MSGGVCGSSGQGAFSLNGVGTRPRARARIRQKTSRSRTGTLGLSLEAAAQSGTLYRLKNASFVITDLHTGDSVDVLFSEDAPSTATELTQVLSPGNYAVDSTAGEGGAFEETPSVPARNEDAAPNRGLGGAADNGDGTTVDASLLSDAVQFFSISGSDDEFVNYTFQIGGQVVDFNHGTLHVGIQVIEDPSVCQTPDGVLDPASARRSRPS